MSGLANPVKWLVDALARGGGDENEKRLTADACLKYAPVWYAVSRIAGHVGQLPSVIYKRIDGGAEPAKEHQAYRLIKSRPNGYQSAFTWKQMTMVHALLCGNGRSLIVRSGNRPIELLPIMPSQSDTVMLDGEKWHLVKLDRELQSQYKLPTLNAAIARQWPDVWAFPDVDVLHIMGLSLNGYCGLRLSDYASQSLGLGMAQERSIAKQTKKGFNGSMFLQAPPGAFPKEEDAKEFLKSVREQHTGEDNTAAIGLLRQGITANVVAMNSRDLQALESRQFQRQDVALWFLLEHITGDATSVSYNSLTERNLAYLSNCLGRWLKVYEEEVDEKLLTEKEKSDDSYFCRFSTGALLKTDMQTTATTISTLISATVLTPNEARSLLDYNPIEGGDKLANPATSSGAAGGNSMGGGDEMMDDKKKMEDKSTGGNKRAMESMLGNLIGVEANRCIAGTKSANFLQWMDSFYLRWEGKLAAEIESLGGDRQLATNHCYESKRRLLECASSATPDELETAVENCVASWPNRVHGIIHELELAYV